MDPRKKRVTGGNGRLALLAAALLALLVTALYLPSVRNGFVYDDATLIVHAPAPRSLADVARVFGERHWDEGLPYYRPVARATMVAQKGLHGDDPAPYHLFNALVAALAALAALALLRRPCLGLPATLAWLGAALFAAHPIASATVYPIASGRETLLPGLFSIAAMWAWLHRGAAWRVASLILLALALLSKEQSVVVPVLFVVADALGLSDDAPARDRAAWIRRYAPVLAVLAGYLAIRIALFGGGGEHALALTRAPAGPLLSLLYAAQSILDPPAPLVYEPRGEVWYSTAHLVVVAFVIGALAVWAWRTRAAVGSRVLFWAAWFVVALLPTANVLEQEAPYAERYVFLSLLGAVGLVATLASTAWPRPAARRSIVVVAAVFLLASAAISAGRARFYADDTTFLQSWVASDARSAKALHAMGQRLAAERRYDEARRYFGLALEVEPDYPAALSNLGSLLAMQGEADHAAELLQRAIDLDPRFVFAYNNLASVRRGQGRAEEAVDLFERSLAIDPDDPHVRFGLGELLLQQGRPERALPHLEAAVLLDRDHGRAHFALGNLFLGVGDRERAERHFDRAALLEPDYAPAHNNLAIVLAQRGEFLRAVVHFERALTLRPDYGQAHLNYGNMLIARGDRADGLRHLERAVALDPASDAARQSLERARASAP